MNKAMFKKYGLRAKIKMMNGRLFLKISSEIVQKEIIIQRFKPMTQF